jgi:hypothetical protein
MMFCVDKCHHSDGVQNYNGPPRRIYIQWEADDVTWCNNKINDNDVEYVRAPYHDEVACTGCGIAFIPSRKPRGRSFCGDCKERGVQQKFAQQRYRDRKHGL